MMIKQPAEVNSKYTMKWYSILIALIIVLTGHTISVAQIYKQMKVRGRHSIYIYTYSEKTILIHKKVSAPMEIPVPLREAQYVTAKPISQSVNEVFSEKKMNKLLAEKLMLAVMYFDSTGKIKYVQFQLDKETKVRPLEIEKLEAALRRNVSCTFLKDDNKAGTYGPRVQGIPFSLILNKTFVN